MLGTVVNTLSIIVGSLIGLVLKNKIKQDYADNVHKVLGLSIVVIGISNALEMTAPLLVIGSLVIGTLIGEMLHLDAKLNKFAEKIEHRFTGSNFAVGFTTASIVYLVGPMAIFGAIESGLNGVHDTLFIKSMLDGTTSIIFTASLGIGVLFSSIPVFIYQGAITLLANLVSTYLTDAAVVNMTAVGGVVILGLGLNLLKLTNIRLFNTTPALLIPIIYYLIF